MQALRSLVFNLFFYAATLTLLIPTCLVIPLGRDYIQGMVRFYARLVVAVGRVVIGLDYEIRGRENLPEGGCLIVSKHQSVWDTMIFYLLCPEPCYVMKKELFELPFWGWAARRSESIAVDRSGGAAALKQLVRDTRDALDKNRQVIIFPEGTRMKVDATRRFFPGVAAMQKGADVPVVPVALNSGLFWGRHEFLKYPGVVTLEFLPPMPAGQDRKTFMEGIQTVIDDATQRLVAEGREKYR